VNVVTDLAQRAENWLDRPALHAEGRWWSHGEVHQRAAGAATVLADHGVRPGDRVLMPLPDGIEWVATFLGTARLGATAVIINPDLDATSHRRIAQDCAPALVVTIPKLEGRFDEYRCHDATSLLSQAADADPAAPHAVDDGTPLYVQYTSGVTGTPKGVVHRHGDLAHYAAVGEGVLNIGPDDIGLSLSKLFFAYGFGNTLVYPLYTGSSAVMLGDRQTPGAVRAAVAQHGVTVLYAVPTAYANLISASDASAFATVRVAVSAGESLRPALWERATAFLGAPLLNQIGSTEVGHTFCANSVDLATPGTIGRPVPGFQLEIRDKAGHPVPDGTEGELWVSGPTLLREYLNRPDDTAEVLRNGWLNTHDRAWCGEDGAYRYLGRADEMEMVTGITMSPLEVEAVLGDHPEVRDIGVAAVPDDKGASVLRAFVVPAESDRAHETLPATLITFARGRLPAFKVPRMVHLVDSLPRTPNGKLRRHQLRNGTW
jgi:fatty acid CoA ligase FadD22